MAWWDEFEYGYELLAALGAILGPLLTFLTLIWALSIKRNSTSAVAWCLVVLFLPVIGPLLFVLFGYQHINRGLARKRRHRSYFEVKHAASGVQVPSDEEEVESPSWKTIGRLASRFGPFPVTSGNHIEFYHEGGSALESMFESIRAAEHHIHLEYFILQPDETGRLVLEELTKKARQGVQVRLLYDAMGSHHLPLSALQALCAAGGQCSMFLPLNLFRRRIQVNMRNHRKIMVADGKVAFTGGLNIGDEYLGKKARFGYWRDTHMRLEGPAVPALQRIFMEDWDFAAGEHLQEPVYSPTPRRDGPYRVQVIESGPDREAKGIREIYFAAVLQARERLWIATPYFIPDAGLLDALCMAGYLGVDVRILCQYQPDKWIPFYAGRYYFQDVLDAGVKVYQYTRGMMHAKVVLVDGQWASVGTANFDNRSLHLNFEVNCLIYSAEAVAELERTFLHDLTSAIRLDRQVFARRPFAGRLMENACRLLSPVL